MYNKKEDEEGKSSGRSQRRRSGERGSGRKKGLRLGLRKKRIMIRRMREEERKTALTA